MMDLSKKFADIVPDFGFNAFQAYTATKIVTNRDNITVASIPTGAGKSFIAALTAYYYH